MVGGLRETCCVYLLFGLSMDEDNLHRPVSEGKAGDTTVCAWSRRVSVSGRVRGPWLYVHHLLLRYNLDRSLDLQAVSVLPSRGQLNLVSYVRHAC